MGIINANFISALDRMSPEAFTRSMDKYAQKGEINVLNWPEQFPYAPRTSFRIARCENALALSFRVRGKDLRATAMQDNGRSWEDSCVEFFIASSDGKGYYNVEITCIGSILLAYGQDRHDRVQQPQVSRIIRRSSLKKEPVEIAGGLHCYRVDVIIPWDVIGYDASKLPGEIKANFYKCGDLTAHPHFVSWNPINTAAPDFHRPEFFGTLSLK